MAILIINSLKGSGMYNFHKNKKMLSHLLLCVQMPNISDIYQIQVIHLLTTIFIEGLFMIKAIKSSEVN